MGQLDGFGAGHQLMVGGLVFGLQHVFARLKQQAGPHKGHVEQHVDLIERQPVFHFARKAAEQHLAVVGVGVHHPAVFPAAVFLDECNGGVEVAESDQRLNAVFVTLVKKALVKFQPLLVGLGIVAVGQDAGPGDGEPVAFEAHLRKEGDVLFIMVVHVDGLMGGVKVPGVTVQHLQCAHGHGEAVRAERYHIHAGQAPPALVVCALALVGGGGTAP